ncbi:hypothetical protein [Leptolyngbya ohadii]|uniref:hypothetical protein n=1 Tax=Leptolyngbya ohadii TaxID=1962290 RepID=UPI0019D4417F|nr:hypothetical protein [Leptolyngbya ohadii]
MEGRRGGFCHQLGVLVQGRWRSCTFATPLFAAPVSPQFQADQLQSAEIPSDASIMVPLQKVLELEPLASCMELEPIAAESSSLQPSLQENPSESVCSDSISVFPLH